VGPGRLLVCNLPADPETSKASALNRTILANLGLALGDGVAQRNTLDANGAITHVLACGLFGAAGPDEAIADSQVSPGSATFLAGEMAHNHPWKSLDADDSGTLPLQTLSKVGSSDTPFVYLSLWLYSPKPLDNLLLDPNLPVVDLKLGNGVAAQIWLGGKSLKTGTNGNASVAPALPLQIGWNHLLAKVVLPPGGSSGLALTLKCSQPDFLGQLRGAEEKP